MSSASVRRDYGPASPGDSNAEQEEPHPVWVGLSSYWVVQALYGLHHRGSLSILVATLEFAAASATYGVTTASARRAASSRCASQHAS